MFSLEFILFIIIILSAVLAYKVIYILYTIKINKVLKNEGKPGNYGSIDKKFFVILIISILSLVGIYLLRYYNQQPKVVAKVPFYEHINSFDIDTFHKDLDRLVNSEDGNIYLEEGFKITTDKDGNIIDASITIVVKKEDDYLIYFSEYNADKDMIIFTYNTLKIAEHFIDSYDTFDSYVEFFNHVDYEAIFEFSNLVNNYTKIEYDFIITDHFHDYHNAENYMINKNGDIKDFDGNYSGDMGKLSMNIYRRYLDGTLPRTSIKHFYILEGEKWKNYINHLYFLCSYLY